MTRTKKLFFEAFLATILVFAIMGLLSLIPLNFSAFKPLDDALEGFDMIDLNYSQLRTHEGQFSKNVVLVNIGNEGRAEIAEIIHFINAGEPAVIGLDAIFLEYKSSFHDELLSEAIANSPKLVNASLYDFQRQELLESNEAFHGHKSGFANFISGEGRTSTIRYFKPSIELDGKQVNAFATELACIANKEAFTRFMNRNNEVEAIKFTGNYSSFLHFEPRELLSAEIDPVIFKDKVVILGFLGKEISNDEDNEDRYYTPLNENLTGRTLPDMSGAVIHANIAEMILSEKWVNRTGNTFKIIFSILITFFHLVLFLYLKTKWDLYFDAVAKVLQVISLLILVYFVFQVYNIFSLRLYVSGGIAGIALAADTLFVYEAIANSFYKRTGLKSILID
jgi:CHASE2 domain-containing sensor protein